MSDRDRAFRILGLEADATIEEIEESYKDLKAVWDPGQFPADSELRRKAEENSTALEKAYELLSGIHRRGPVETRLGTSVAEGMERGRGPSILDDTFSERKGGRKRWWPVWLGLFIFAAAGALISYLTWSPVPVEPSKPSELESVVAEVKAAQSEAEEQERERAREAEGASDKGLKPVQEESAGHRTEAEPEAAPEESPQISAVVPAEPHVVVPAKPRVETSPTKSRGSEVEEEKTKQAETALKQRSEPTDEAVVEEEPKPSALAERAYQILRAKSYPADQLASGGVVAYTFTEWTAMERSSTEVYVDLVAESVSEGREIHFVWSVDVENQSVRAMSQAARDLEAAEK